MASAMPERRGHGTRGLHRLESAYTITSAAAALEALLSISSSLWGRLRFPGRVSVVSICVLIVNLCSPFSGFHSRIEVSMPANVNMIARMTTWVLGDLALGRLSVRTGVYLICRQIAER